jgi:hypothetical protein
MTRAKFVITAAWNVAHLVIVALFAVAMQHDGL